MLSVYHREKPEYLRQCLDSVFSQTFRASEIILVGDGPLTEALDTMIDCYQNNYPELQFVPLKENHGLGLAHSSLRILMEMTRISKIGNSRIGISKTIGLHKWEIL